MWVCVLHQFAALWAMVTMGIAPSIKVLHNNVFCFVSNLHTQKFKWTSLTLLHLCIMYPTEGEKFGEKESWMNQDSRNYRNFQPIRRNFFTEPWPLRLIGWQRLVCAHYTYEWFTTAACMPLHTSNNSTHALQCLCPWYPTVDTGPVKKTPQDGIGHSNFFLHWLANYSIQP